MHQLLHSDPPCASRAPSRLRPLGGVSTGSNAVLFAGMAVICERGDSNPHGCPPDPKSGASANSATLASHTPKLMAIGGCPIQDAMSREGIEPSTYGLRVRCS